MKLSTGKEELVGRDKVCEAGMAWKGLTWASYCHLCKAPSAHILHLSVPNCFGILAEEVAACTQLENCCGCSD